MPSSADTSTSPRLEASDTIAMGFPLPKGYFGDIRLSDAKRRGFRAIVQNRVDALLQDEQRYTSHQTRHQPTLHPPEWKLVRSHEELQIFRRRRRGRSLRDLACEEDFEEAQRAVEHGQPSMLALGRVSGTIEDMLYGSAATTQEEMQTTMAYADQSTDCALLDVLELAPREDPLHFLGLKWVVNKLALKVARVVVPRDTCYLEAMGMERDSKGEKYGYLVLHSVDLPECPPFDRKHVNAIRGKIFFSCLFRESSPNFLSVLVRGVFDMGGELPHVALSRATASYICGLFKAVGCATAKKLTLLQRQYASVKPTLEDEALAWSSAVCSVCNKGGGHKLFSGGRLQACRVCTQAVCSKCSTKQRVFLGIHRPCSTALCCPSCVLKVERMRGVRPAETQYGVVADYYTQTPGFSSTAGLSTYSYRSNATNLYAPSDVSSEDYLDSGPVVLAAELAKVPLSADKTVSSSMDEAWDIGGRAYGRLETASDLESDGYRFSLSSRDGSDVGSQYGEHKPTARAYASSEPMPNVLREAGENRPRARLRTATENSPMSTAVVTTNARTSAPAAIVVEDDVDLSAQERAMMNHGMPNHARGLLQKMMQLQTSMDEVRSITQANEEMMRKNMR